MMLSNPHLSKDRKYFQAFIIKKSPHSHVYTCISDHYGKMTIYSIYLGMGMPNIKRGLFINCEEAPQNGNKLIYFPLNTSIVGSVAEWTHRYTHTMHLIYLICIEYVKPGIATQELWNALTPLSWDISPTSHDLLHLIVRLFYYTGCMSSLSPLVCYISDDYDSLKWHQTIPTNNILEKNIIISALIDCAHYNNHNQSAIQQSELLIRYIFEFEINMI